MLFIVVFLFSYDHMHTEARKATHADRVGGRLQRVWSQGNVLPCALGKERFRIIHGDADADFLSRF